MKKLLLLAFTTMLLISCGKTIQPNTNLDVPTNLIASCNYLQEVTISWDYDNGIIESFIIQRKIDDGDYAIIDTIGADVYEYIDSDLTACTTNSYKVAAICDECMGEWSDETSVYVKAGFQSLNFGMEATLEVVTWNIEHFPKNLNLTVEYVVQIMRGIDADIYALQEIESNSHFEYIIETLNYEDDENIWAGYRANTSGYHINLAYIYKSDQVQLGNIYEIYQDDWYAFPRNPLVLEFTFSGTDLIVINNHLKAGGDSDDEVIVLGDLNDELTDSQNNNVFTAFLNEADEYEFADMNIAEGSSVYWSYPSGGWLSHLDHILITNELFDEFIQQNSDVQTLRIDELLDSGWSEYDNNISDHRPVGLKLAFP